MAQRSHGGRNAADEGAVFIQSAAVLGGAGLAAKVVGAFYRIPLANILGAEGSGYYGIAYPVYSVLAAISSIGIPTAISHITAAALGSGQPPIAAQILRTARRFMLILGGCLAAVLFIGADSLAAAIREPPVTDAFRAISPSCFFVCVIACYRGVLQGFEIMKPTALSQVMEQFGKLGLGLTAAWTAVSTGCTPAVGAAAALGGIACSEAVVAAYIARSCRKSDAWEVLDRPARTRNSSETGKGLLRRLVAEAVPVTVSACIMPIILAFDSVLAAPALQAAGISAPEAAAQVGLLTMDVEPLVNLPAALSSALAVSVVPALAASFAKGDMAGCSERTNLALRMAILIGLPCAAGFALFGRPIIELLYDSLSPDELNAAGEMLQIMSISVLCLTAIQTVTGVLQGIGRRMMPVAALCIGAAVKAGSMMPMIRAAGISGAAWSSVVCFMVVALLDMRFLSLYAPSKDSMRIRVAGPLYAVAAMSVGSWALYLSLRGLSRSGATISAVVVGAVIYVFMLCRLGSISSEELSLLPGGRRLVHWALKLRLWKDFR